MRLTVLWIATVAVALTTNGPPPPAWHPSRAVARGRCQFPRSATATPDQDEHRKQTAWVPPPAEPWPTTPTQNLSAVGDPVSRSSPTSWSSEAAGASEDDADEASSTAQPRSGGRSLKWLVVAAWARWQRSSLFAHLSTREQDGLRGALARFAEAHEADEAPLDSTRGGSSVRHHLEARLEMCEVMLTVGADGPSCTAAFFAGLETSPSASVNFGGDEDSGADEAASWALASEMRALRRHGLWTPIARPVLENDDTTPEEPQASATTTTPPPEPESSSSSSSSSEQQPSLGDADAAAAPRHPPGTRLDAAAIQKAASWAELDAVAAPARRSVALATRDARALVAELAAICVALRRADDDDARARATRRVLALQAVHIHLPLAELLRAAAAKVVPPLQQPPQQLFEPDAYAALVREVEDRSYSALFPETYAVLRFNARAAEEAADLDVPAFALRARALIADAVSRDAVAAAAFGETLSRPSSARTRRRRRGRRRGEDRRDDDDDDEVSSSSSQDDDDDAAAASSGASELSREELRDRICDRLMVAARVKSPASALRKMLRKTGTVSAVRDLLGLRVVVLPESSTTHGGTPPILMETLNTVPVVEDTATLEAAAARDDDDDVAAAYAVYRAAATVWPELPGRFKDYVRRPKPSGYQSLHATLWIRDVPMEIQVRTLRMHLDAETGDASHARYLGRRRDEALAAEIEGSSSGALHDRRLLLPGGDLGSDNDDAAAAAAPGSFVVNTSSHGEGQAGDGVPAAAGGVADDDERSRRRPRLAPSASLETRVEELYPPYK